MEDCSVVIAGAGVAATAVACSLARSGFRPVLLRVGISPREGAEALPPEAFAQIDALDWGPVFSRAGAVEVDGFENRLADSPGSIKPGVFLHVDRARLVEAALCRAIEEGAVVLNCPRLPSLREEAGGIVLDALTGRHFVAIDATGRTAAWSRPRRRRGRQAADLFRGPSGPDAARGCVTGTPFGWAYRIGLPGSQTIGSISTGDRRPGDGAPNIAARFGLTEQEVQFVGRCAAFPQWAESPARGRRLAIGDAAFASNPIAGQGIRFALASALAAASVVRTIRDTGHVDSASTFYNAWVSGAVRRHVDFLDGLGRPDAGPSEGAEAGGADSSLGAATPVRFAARTVETGLNVDGVIAPGLAVVLPDGGLARWLGAFDLLLLRELAKTPIVLRDLAGQLQAHGLGPGKVDALLRWCLLHRVLAPAETPEFGGRADLGRWEGSAISVNV